MSIFIPENQDEGGYSRSVADKRFERRSNNIVKIPPGDPGTFIISDGNKWELSGESAGNIRLGSNSSLNSFSTESVCIGNNAGFEDQALRCIAIGQDSGYFSQGGASVAIGYKSGESKQAPFCVAIGSQSGNSNQSNFSVAIGREAGMASQGINSIAIGQRSGQDRQGNNCVSIGNGSGSTQQADSSILVGQNNQTVAASGSNGIAVGNSITISTNNGIGLNGVPAPLSVNAAGFFVKPVRSSAGSFVLNYSSGSGEITYNPFSLKYKQNIRSVDNTESVYGLEAKMFDYKESNPPYSENRIGFIAEEADSVDPRLAIRDENDEVQNIDQTAILAFMLAEMKKLKARLDALTL